MNSPSVMPRFPRPRCGWSGCWSHADDGRWCTRHADLAALAQARCGGYAGTLFAVAVGVVVGWVVFRR